MKYMKSQRSRLAWKSFMAELTCPVVVRLAIAKVVFLHHIVSGCSLEEEAAQAPEELKKSVDKIFKAPRCL